MKVIIIHVRETQRDRLKDSEWERRKYVSIRDSEGVYLCDACSSWFMLVQSSWSSKTKCLSDETG